MRGDDLRPHLPAAEPLLQKAGLAIDRAFGDPTTENVAWAKVLSTKVALFTTNKLFEFAGTRSTPERY